MILPGGRNPTATMSSPSSKRRRLDAACAAAAERIKCPYLDTVRRQVLDFDFEKVRVETVAVGCCGTV